MYLSQIELVGFKSFAHKTSINFNDGITAIVGPNGCGKTNIVDAIRWVLGEQKSSVLRSERMENVIFGGTMNRRRLGYAEVSLVVENTKNILPIDYSQIMITRRLYRSGESEYLLNKQMCRLKDISNLLMDSGMGADAYSVIELSMVEMLLKDSDEYRKRLFEEASGITKYKSRRQETLRKLETTKQDLVRVKDIIGEVERNVNALKSQVGRANRYEKLRTELVAVEKQYYNCGRNELFKKKKPLEDEIIKHTNHLNALSGKSAKNKAVIDKAQSEILAKQDLLSNAQNKFNAFTERVRRTDSNYAQLQERSVALMETEKRLIAEVNIFEGKIKENDNQITNTKEKIKALRMETHSTEQDIKRFDSRRGIFLSEYKQKKEIYINKSQQIFDVIKILEEKNRKRDAVIRDNQERNAHFERLKSIQKNSHNRLKELRERQKRLNDDKNRMQSEIDTLNNERDNKLASSEQTDELISKFEQMLHTHTISLESLKTKLQFLTNLIEEHGGLPGGVAAVLNAKDKLDGVLGTIAELVSVSHKYRAAVESVLGEQAHYIVVDTLQNVSNAIKYLRSLKSGRATFVALEKIARLPEDVFPKTDVERIKNSSLLIDKVSAPDSLKNVLSLLMGDVVFVDDSDIHKIARSIDTFPYRIVNNNGEIISIGYLYSGGSVSEHYTGVIGRKERIAELESENRAVEAEMKTTGVKLEEARVTRKKIQEDIAQIDEKLTLATGDVESVNRTLGIVNFELDQVSQNIEKLETETKQLGLFKKDTTILDSLTKEISVLQAERDKLQNERETFQNEEEALDTERQNFEDQYSEYKAKIARFGESVLSLEREEQRLKILQKEFEADAAKRKISLLEVQQQQKATHAKIEELREALDKLFKEQHELEENVLQSREELNKIEEEKRSDLDSFLGTQNNMNTIKEEIQNCKEQLVEIQQELKFLEDTLRSKGIDTDNLNAPDDEYDLEEIVLRKQRFIKKIETFGPVNFEAFEEYNKEVERLHFLQTQTQDLEDAENTLIETINKINATAQERFQLTFQLIRQNFRNIFRSFFGDGEADIHLEGTGDPLDAKIEVFAQPFGKKVQSIALLSGGEKSLTALAILLAIYRVKPSPFCILDEVDAPLDDANIARFVTMLNEFSKDTQFIVVTHNKKTMEAARNLYGVTMEETGISKIISVRINHEGEAFNHVDSSPGSDTLKSN